MSDWPFGEKILSPTDRDGGSFGLHPGSKMVKSMTKQMVPQTKTGIASRNNNSNNNQKGNSGNNDTNRNQGYNDTSRNQGYNDTNRNQGYNDTNRNQGYNNTNRNQGHNNTNRDGQGHNNTNRDSRGNNNQGDNRDRLYNQGGNGANNNIQRSPGGKSRGGSGTQRKVSHDSLQNIPKPVAIIPGSTLRSYKEAENERKTFKTIESSGGFNRTNHSNPSYSSSAPKAQTKTLSSSTLVNPNNGVKELMNELINNKGSNKKNTQNPRQLNLVESKPSAVKKNINQPHKKPIESNTVKRPPPTAIIDMSGSQETGRKSARKLNKTPKAPEIVDLLDSDDDMDDPKTNESLMDVEPGKIIEKCGQSDDWEFTAIHLYIENQPWTRKRKCKVKTNFCPPMHHISYIRSDDDSSQKSCLEIDINSIIELKYGRVPSRDELGFVEFAKAADGEDDLPKHLIVARFEDIKSFQKVLKVRGIIINEIYDTDTKNEIMSVHRQEFEEEKEEKPVQKRKSRRIKAIGENPEDNDLFLIYPIDPDAFDPITITKGCIKRLEEGEYFNDNLIDYKIKVFMEQLQVSNPTLRAKVHAFSCQFFIKMTEKKTPREMYELVARWTKDLDIFDLDFLFVPVNIGSHWSLSVIVRPGLISDQSTCDESFQSDSQASPENIQSNKPCIMFMDSLNLHSMGSIGNKLRSYVEYEWNVKRLNLDINTLGSKDKQDVKVTLTTKTFPVVKCSVPQQPNGTDCGVYVIRFVNLILKEWPKSPQNDINNGMRNVITASSFEHEEIVDMRVEMKDTINSMKGDFDASRQIIQDRKMKEKEEKREKRKLEKENTEVNTESNKVTKTSHDEENNDKNLKTIKKSQSIDDEKNDSEDPDERNDSDNNNQKGEDTDTTNDDDKVDNKNTNEGGDIVIDDDNALFFKENKLK